ESEDVKIVPRIRNSPAAELSAPDFFKLLKIFSAIILNKLPESSEFLKLGCITAEPLDQIKMRNRISNHTNFILMHSAASILLDWPQKFYEFLEEYSKIDRSMRRDTGMEKYFGGLRDLLLNKLDTDKFGFIYHAYYNYLNERWTGGHIINRTKISGSPKIQKIQKKNITLVEACEILGCGERNFVSGLVDQKIIRTVVYKAGSKNRYIIDAESVYSLKRMMDKMLTISDLANRLDISIDRVGSFVRNGLLPPIKHRPWKPQHSSLFDLEGVERFEKEFLSEERYSAVDKKPEGYLSIREASRAITMPIAGLLQLIRQGVFNPIICRKEKGLSKLLFSENELDKYRNAYTEKKRNNNRLSVYQAGIIIGLDMRFLQHLINIGLITATVENDGGKQRTYVHKKDLERFKGEYIFIEEAAELIGFSTETLFQWIKQGRLKDYSGIHITRRTKRRILNREEVMPFMPGASMDVQQVAEYLSLSPESVYTLIRKNILPTLKGNGLGETSFNRIPQEEVVRYKENFLSLYKKIT
ncbi:MAG TPA: helix-turn-helix domain-containing protein, partial [Candidatus Methanoperedens sp.]